MTHSFHPFIFLEISVYGNESSYQLLAHEYKSAIYSFNILLVDILPTYSFSDLTGVNFADRGKRF